MWGSGSVFSFLLNLDTTWRWVVSFTTPAALPPRQRSSASHWIRGWVGPWASLNWLLRRKISGRIQSRLICCPSRSVFTTLPELSDSYILFVQTLYRRNVSYYSFRHQVGIWQETHVLPTKTCYIQILICRWNTHSRCWNKLFASSFTSFIQNSHTQQHFANITFNTVKSIHQPAIGYESVPVSFTCVRHLLLITVASTSL